MWRKKAGGLIRPRQRVRMAAAAAIGVAHGSEEAENDDGYLTPGDDDVSGPEEGPAEDDAGAPEWWKRLTRRKVPLKKQKKGPRASSEGIRTRGSIKKPARKLDTKEKWQLYMITSLLSQTRRERDTLRSREHANIGKFNLCDVKFAYGVLLNRNFAEICARVPTT